MPREPQSGPHAPRADTEDRTRSVRTTLIVGADGGIGSALAHRLPHAIRTSRRRGSDTALSLDLAAASSSWTLPESVSVAFLCAARCSIDDCRKNPAETRFINVEQTVRLAESLAARGAFLVFLSTNQVFDGSAPFRKPIDATCPLTEYGRQKADTEQAILALGGAVVRFTKVFAGVPPLFETWAEKLLRGELIEPFADMMFSPVPIAEATDTLVKVAEVRAAGITHVSGDRDISYADAAQFLAARLGAGPALIRPASAQAAAIPPEARPTHTALATRRPIPVHRTLRDLFALRRGSFTRAA